MSTRATIHFEHVQTQRWDVKRQKLITLRKPKVSTDAIIYRHNDGYPEGLGQELVRFIQEVRQLQDSRLDDPSYLAAKWVVFDVLLHQAYHAASNEQRKAVGQEPYYPDPIPRLDFLSIGIVMEDPGDIEYRYHVIADGRVEQVTWDGGYGEAFDEHGEISTLEGVTA